MLKLDCVIIGGGIVGLCTAKQVALKYPQWEIALIEESSYLCDQGSGRNSGVLHSGLYYKTNSLKHVLCMEGHRLWRQEEKFIRICGKMIVGQDLDDLYSQGLKNAVNLRKASPSELHRVSEYTPAQEAIYSPETGVIDFGVFKWLEYQLSQLNVNVIKGQKVKILSADYTLQIGNDEIHSEAVINVAGLKAVEVRRQLGLNDFSNTFVKGRWLASTEPFLAPWLIYPKPLKGLKGLGVHSCINFDGSVRFGPDTQDIEGENYDYQFGDPSELIDATLSLFPRLNPMRLHPDTVGIRTKLKETNDFVIQSPLSGYVEAIGIESPGLTAAPAIAQKLVSLI